MSRTYKKAYRGSKVFDSSCRNHGGCGYCEGNRTFKFNNKGNKETEIKSGVREYDTADYYTYYCFDMMDTTTYKY